MGICSSAEVYPESSQSNSQPEKGGAPQPILYLTEDEKKLLVKHFRETLIAQRPDIYHKTMLLCINASPKMNEIIACQQYCMRDLTQWPKLNKMCQAQKEFIDALIYVDHLENDPMIERIGVLAKIHTAYLKYGFKPHFLDLWRHHVDAQMDRLSMESSEEKAALLKAMSTLNEFIVDALYTSFNEEKKLGNSTSATPAPVSPAE